MTLSSPILGDLTTMSAPIAEEGSGGVTPAPKTVRKRAPRKRTTKKDDTKEE
jgi:hypothetical protein